MANRFIEDMLFCTECFALVIGPRFYRCCGRLMCGWCWLQHLIQLHGSPPPEATAGPGPDGESGRPSSS